jgi:hypothetical protein
LCISALRGGFKTRRRRRKSPEFAKPAMAMPNQSRNSGIQVEWSCLGSTPVSDPVRLSRHSVSSLLLDPIKAFRIKLKHRYDVIGSIGSLMEATFPLMFVKRNLSQLDRSPAVSCSQATGPEVLQPVSEELSV